MPIIYLEDSPDVIYYDSVLHVWMFPAIFGVLLVAMGAKQVLRLRSSMNS